MYTRWSPELTSLLDAKSGTQTVRIKDLEYHVLPCEHQASLLSIAANLDDIIENGNRQKYSKKSTASLFSVNSETFFAKHVRFYQKAFGLRFRYFVQPSRSYWTAVVAKRIEEAGIGTPKVYAVGERRTHQLISATPTSSPRRSKTRIRQRKSSANNPIALTYCKEPGSFFAVFMMRASRTETLSLRTFMCKGTPWDFGTWIPLWCLILIHRVNGLFVILADFFPLLSSRLMRCLRRSPNL